MAWWLAGSVKSHNSNCSWQPITPDARHDKRAYLRKKVNRGNGFNVDLWIQAIGSIDDNLISTDMSGCW